MARNAARASAAVLVQAPLGAGKCCGDCTAAVEVSPTVEVEAPTVPTDAVTPTVHAQSSTAVV